MGAALEQTVIHLGRRLIAKLLAVEHLANALAFCCRQGPRLRTAWRERRGGELSASRRPRA
jgi:hypothetical protein